VNLSWLLPHIKVSVFKEYVTFFWRVFQCHLRTGSDQGKEGGGSRKTPFEINSSTAMCACVCVCVCVGVFACRGK